MPWGWRKILQIRPLIQQFIWHNLGVWLWLGSITGVRYVLSRSLLRHGIFIGAGFDFSSRVKDVINNDGFLRRQLNWRIILLVCSSWIDVVYRVPGSGSFLLVF